LTIEERHVLIN